MRPGIYLVIELDQHPKLYESLTGHDAVSLSLPKLMLTYILLVLQETNFIEKNTTIFIQENALEKVVCQVLPFLFGPQYVKHDYPDAIYTIFQHILYDDWWLTDFPNNKIVEYIPYDNKPPSHPLKLYQYITYDNHPPSLTTEPISAHYLS